jgi:hypothetical protein
MHTGHSSWGISKVYRQRGVGLKQGQKFSKNCFINGLKLEEKYKDDGLLLTCSDSSSTKRAALSL